MLKKNVYHGRKITSQAQLKEALLEECNKFPQETINKAIDAFKKHVEIAIDEQGEYIQKYL